MTKIEFRPGKNIAIKTPSHEFQALVEFYRDTLGFKVLKQGRNNVSFEFGGKILWVDHVPHVTQAEIWLEVHCPQTDGARDYLRQKGVRFSEQVEPLDDGFPGFWISAPGNLIHLIAGDY